MRLTTLDDVVGVIEAAPSGRRVIVGITGPPGAGKTHLARALGAPVVALDGFHLPNDELSRLGRTQRKGAPDTFDIDRFVLLLRDLRCGATVAAPAFSRELDAPVAHAVSIAADASIVLVEGNYLLLTDGRWAAVRPLLDLLLYVEAPDDVRRSRLLVRQERRFGDADTARRWVDAVDEPNARLIEACKQWADHVVAIEHLPGEAIF